jgi:hypothetical protein
MKLGRRPFLQAFVAIPTTFGFGFPVAKSALPLDHSATIKTRTPDGTYHILGQVPVTVFPDRVEAKEPLIWVNTSEEPLFYESLEISWGSIRIPISLDRPDTLMPGNTLTLTWPGPILMIEL